MKISTSRFGNIEINDTELIVFDEGLLGFTEYHRYIVLNANEHGPFRWLQCIDDGNLAFVVIEPLNFMFEYNIEISDEDAAFIDINRVEDAVIYVIVSIPKNPQDMTANLQGPLIINVVNRKGKQIVSIDPRHPVKIGILKEMERRTEKLKELQKSLDPKPMEDES